MVFSVQEISDDVPELGHKTPRISVKRVKTIAIVKGEGSKNLTALMYLSKNDIFGFMC